MNKNIVKSLNKQNKGITLIALVITVVVLLIIASIATYSGIEAINTSKYTTFIAELKIVQSHVNQWYDDCKSKVKNENTFEEIIQQKFSSVGISNVNVADDTTAKSVLTNLGFDNYTDFYRIKQEKMTSLGIEGVTRDVIVSVKNRKVVSYEGLEYKDKTYYTIDDSDIDAIYNVDYTNNNTGNVGFSVKYNYIENGLARVTIPEDSISYEGYNKKWKVKYRLNDGPWNTSDDLNFIINKYGNYEIGLYNDNISQNIIANTWKGEILSKSQKINKSIGQTVNYTENSGKVDSWRLFYASDDEVFLISSNGVSPKDAFSPDGEHTKGIPLAPRGKYSWDATNSNYSYTNESDKYSGASNVFSTNYGKIYNQNWWNETQNEMPDTQDRSKATSFLCDPSNWTEYVGENAPKGTYAVGGPTKELLVRSWKASGQSEDSLEELLDDTIATVAGYNYDKPIALRNNNPILRTILPKTQNGNDGLYNTGDEFYWLASPCNYNVNVICCVQYPGNRISSSYSYIDGFIRPIVSIPISNVSVIESENEGVVTTIVSINNN